MYHERHIGSDLIYILWMDRVHLTIIKSPYASNTFIKIGSTCAHYTQVSMLQLSVKLVQLTTYVEHNIIVILSIAYYGLKFLMPIIQ